MNKFIFTNLSVILAIVLQLCSLLENTTVVTGTASTTECVSNNEYIPPAAETLSTTEYIPPVTETGATTEYTPPVAETGATTEYIPPAAPVQTTGFADTSILDSVNSYRIEAGLVPLTLSDSLCQAALVRCSEITISMSHTRPDGRSCSSVYADLGISIHLWGENLGAGYSSGAAVAAAWIDSDSHRNNILSPSFTHAGVYYILDETTGITYWVILFSD